MVCVLCYGKVSSNLWYKFFVARTSHEELFPICEGIEPDDPSGEYFPQEIPCVFRITLCTIFPPPPLLFFLITHQSIFIGKTTAKYKIDLRRSKIAISLFTFNYKTE